MTEALRQVNAIATGAEDAAMIRFDLNGCVLTRSGQLPYDSSLSIGRRSGDVLSVLGNECLQGAVFPGDHE
jgi:hypothetical protein